jgi:hypothetical protein
MRSLLIVAATVLAVASSGAQAQTDLTAYADPQGYIDVQALTCAALAGTWQEDADRLTTWYNGLGKKHFLNVARSKELEHEVILYCKANPQIRIIQAIDAMLKQDLNKISLSLSTNKPKVDWNGGYNSVTLSVSMSWVMVALRIFCSR